LSADCRLNLTVRTAGDRAEVEAAMDLRVRVFCGEQGVDPSEEMDDLDDESTQVVGLDETGVIATCRLRDLSDRQWKLERMAVEQRLRGLGVGARLLAGAEREAREHGVAEMVLNAQRQAEPFYAGHGYIAHGDSFTEAGIEHVQMRKAL
jgi:predicted GNAT family N-acyltransferase